jgi:hypothetical protein
MIEGVGCLLSRYVASHYGVKVKFGMECNTSAYP